MNFYTIECYDAWYRRLDDGPMARAARSYETHLDAVRHALPGNVVALAEMRGIDDGLVVRVRHDRADRRLALTMRCGDLQIGYYDLTITYEDATISDEHDSVLSWVARSTRGHVTFECEVAFHEIGITDSGLVDHRLLFHPGVWFGIVCRSLEWRGTPRSSRRIPPMSDRYPGGPTPRFGADDAPERAIIWL